MELRALAVEMPRAPHPNRIGFRGVLSTVDVSSDRAPAGARGHRVMLTRDAANAALPSLIGMALDYTPSLDGHDAKRKVGIITSAEIEGKELLVSGYIFGRDFPELTKEMRGSRERLGMSYELADARVRDVRSPVWMLDEVTFTGAAILLKGKAAYGSTWIELDTEDLTNKKWRGPTMNQEQSKELANVTQRMASAAEALSESIARLNAQHEDLSAKVERIVAAVEEDESESAVLRAKVAELESANTELREKLQAGAAVSTRKTLPPIVTALLAKSGVEVGDAMDAAALDAAMSPLSIEQRIAVKAQMARAGLIG
ncbi:MAG: hypothetical protein JWO13_1356 [Acidobacteriales bacterium]|nr:hypothetical protein [Terriglobales bacterium]